MYCPKCGYNCEHNDVFCPNCGTSLKDLKQKDQIDSSLAQKVNIEYPSNDNLTDRRNDFDNEYHSKIGTYALVFSIVGLFVPYIGLLLEIVAIVLGNKAKRTVSERDGKIGKIIAIVGIVISLFVSLICYLYLISA